MVRLEVLLLQKWKFVYLTRDLVSLLNEAIMVARPVNKAEQFPFGITRGNTKASFG